MKKKILRIINIFTAVLGLLNARIKVKSKNYFADLIYNPNITNSTEQNLPNEQELIYILKTAERFCIGRIACLERSIYLRRYLIKRGIVSNIIVGVKKHPFRAHAWVEVDGKRFCDYGISDMFDDFTRIEYRSR